MRDDLQFGDKRILLVEDDLIVVEKVSRQLSLLGFAGVFVATSLIQAEDILEREQIDLAVLDVNMRTGETTIALGWALTAENIPTVFFSGLNPQDMARMTQGHEFMEKPISPSRLRAALHRAMLRAPSQAQSFKDKKMAGQSARQ